MGTASSLWSNYDLDEVRVDGADNVIRSIAVASAGGFSSMPWTVKHVLIMLLRTTPSAKRVYFLPLRLPAKALDRAWHCDAMIQRHTCAWDSAAPLPYLLPGPFQVDLGDRFALSVLKHVWRSQIVPMYNGRPLSMSTTVHDATDNLFHK